MRVFLVRISQRRWTLYSEKAEFIANKASLSVESSNAADMVMDDTDPASKKQESSQRSMMKRLQGAVAYTKAKAVESRREIDEASEGVGVKGRLKQLLIYLESKIHPEEAIFQQFSSINVEDFIVDKQQQSTSTSTSSSSSETLFKILYPSNLGERRAFKYTGVVVRQRASYHKFWSIVHTLMIPFTVAATILPGPNVFLAYNIYRLYSHLTAIKGTNNLKKLLNVYPNEMFQASDALMEYEQHHFQPIEHTINMKPTTSTATTTTESSPLLQQIQQQHIHTVKPHHTHIHIHQPNFKLKNDLIARLAGRVQTPGLLEHIKKIEENEKKQLIH
ncbi:hypothetical protein DFA_03583 [Cavenderia fasciculata]|uniref:Uncharacterized protein n=1 Tax=Cavenderia fasciculata TaxID=261658 RepID=F4PI51_CACFS|nr:uncharacterized protein DFA_03583 [Cavenderia fasciculata]EGG25334.1 hypothetical protein DFA_03583 [Cavenderia fasciculata]|eukprot:XP_004363185.1 hypothetical protein DFA_03583 [Cavenderia fasciculata]